MTRAAAPAAAAPPLSCGPSIPSQAGAREAVGIPAPPGRSEPVPDPVRVFLLRHHAVCADAVDPFELAARLEERGVTDRAAAACGHRDVFSLAAELYARADGGSAGGGPGSAAGTAVLPGAGGLCAARPRRSRRTAAA
ncbi:hypothetical protein JNW98_35005, partial [Streptomyces sp. SCA2-4]|nr:hypothetical protein [Streptomyces huiliensis]